MTGVCLGYNANAPVRPDAMTRGLETGRNRPSAPATGQVARASVEEARPDVPARIGVASPNIAFTGAREVNALAIGSAVAMVAKLGWRKRRLSAGHGADDKPFVALMLANNETGVVQPRSWPPSGSALARRLRRTRSTRAPSLPP
jgi:cysteine desulfurase